LGFNFENKPVNERDYMTAQWQYHKHLTQSELEMQKLNLGESANFEMLPSLWVCAETDCILLGVTLRYHYRQTNQHTNFPWI
jgi:hypothetical protein